MRTRTIRTLISRRKFFYEICKSTNANPPKKESCVRNVLKSQPHKDEFIPAKREQYIIDAINEQLD